MNRKERERRQQWAQEERADFSAGSLASWAKRSGMSEEQAIQICDNLKNDFEDSANYHKAPITLVTLVLMELLAQSLAQQAANRTSSCTRLTDTVAARTSNNDYPA